VVPVLPVVEEEDDDDDELPSELEEEVSSLEELVPDPVDDS